MQLRFWLLLLVALVVLVVAGSVAAREETKRQDNTEATGLETDGEKSRKQKDEFRLDSGKARVKQKWQRHKPPSCKKAKKAALHKEKALAKSGKEKWKAAAEEARGKKVERSERDTAGRQKPEKKGKPWKAGKEKRDRVWKEPKEERLQPSGEAKRANVDKLRQGSKGRGKRPEKDDRKSSEHDSACAKDQLCADSSDESVGSEKKKWKRENGGKGGTREKTVQSSKAGDENPSDGTESVSASGSTETESDKNVGEDERGDVLKQRTPEGIKQATKPKGRTPPETAPAEQVGSPEVSASKVKAAKVDRQEDTDGTVEEAGEDSTEGAKKNSSGNRKVKRSYVVEEEYDPECTGCWDGLLTDDTGGTESGNWNTVKSLSGQSRVRRYIVEEEIIEESADGDPGATGADEMPRFMQ